LSPGDIVSSHHRPTGHALAAGLDPGLLLAELLGRSAGYCKGMAGKHQVSALAHGFLGANGVVGGGIPLAIGAALAQHMQGTDRATVAYFGDGATNTGAFHESVNLAAVWNLPCSSSVKTTDMRSRRGNRIISASKTYPIVRRLTA